MAAEDLIASLDEGLSNAGQTVTMRRQSGTVPTITNYDASVLAAVRSFQPEELIGGIVMTDSKVILSPTGLSAWPGDGTGSNPAPDIPKINDKVVIAGRQRNVKVVDPIYVNDTLVRIELAVAG
jgi:hypothetical protein